MRGWPAGGVYIEGNGCGSVVVDGSRRGGGGGCHVVRYCQLSCSQ